MILAIGQYVDMKSILIINSPLFRTKNPLYDEDSLPPLGLGYIATILENRGFKVELEDAVADNIPLTNLIKLIENRHPDFVALNIFTTNYEIVKDLVEAISIPVSFIIGGLSTKTLFTKIWDWRTPNAITIVIGDGELIVPDIVEGKVSEAAFHEEPNRKVFKVETQSKYFPADISAIPLNRKFFKNEPTKHLFGFSEANIVTSRGCIYNCAFCAAARSLNSDFAIREKTSTSIVAELNEIIELYPKVDSIRVLDDLFLKNRHTIAKAIEAFSHFSLQWRSMAHVLTFKGVDFDSIQQLKKTGCSELFIGIESGSPDVLKRIHKTHDTSVVLETLTNLFRAGINVKGYFIYGFPGETESDFKQTFELACRLKESAAQHGARFRVSVFQFRPYDGTELYHQLQRQTSEGNVNAVRTVEPNEKLSSLVGRLQFNFHSGNYSAEPLETVHKYIYLTTNLNPTDLFNPQNPTNLKAA